MKLGNILDICIEYNRLGWAVHEQLQSVIDGDNLSEQNDNALEMIKEFLLGVVTLQDSESREETLELIESIKNHLKENE